MATFIPGPSNIMGQIMALTTPSLVLYKEAREVLNNHNNNKAKEIKETNVTTNESQNTHSEANTNNEYCDACSGAGDLLCCDGCSTSLHLICCEPPFRSHQLPEDDWFCPRCVRLRQDEAEKFVFESNSKTNKSSQQSKRDSDSDSSDTNEYSSDSDDFSSGELYGASQTKSDSNGFSIKRSLRSSQVRSDSDHINKKRLATCHDKSDSNHSLESAKIINDLDNQIGARPLKIASADTTKEIRWIVGYMLNKLSHSNPEEFKTDDITRNIRNENPYTSLTSYNLQQNFQSISTDMESHDKRQQNELSDKPKESTKQKLNEEIPLNSQLSKATSQKTVQLSDVDDPETRMFICCKCGRGCRRAPLLNCDFCPLAYHADCLDPPLTTLPAPSKYWMCPNHPENHMEDKILPGRPFSERVKIWDLYTRYKPNEKEIQLEFLKKIHGPHPSEASSKNNLEVEFPPIRVPEAVKDAYRYRPDLLPAPNCISQFYDNCSQWKREKESSKFTKYKPPTFEHHEEGLKGLLLLNNANTDARMTRNQSNYETKDSSQNLTKPPSFDLKRRNSFSLNDLSMIKETLNLSTLPNGEFTADYENPFNFLKISANEDSFSNCDSVETLSCDSDIDDSHTDKSNNVLLVSNFSKKPIDQNNDFAMLDQMDTKLVRLLAFQRLQQLQFDSLRVKKVTDMSTSNVYMEKSGFYFGANLRSRASVCPVVVNPLQKNYFSTEAKSMVYRTFALGTNRDNDLVLNEYGHCNYVSSKHAVIFFDEIERNFELINYSQYGTVVDNVRYSCDISDKLAHHRTLYNSIESTFSGIREYISDEPKETKTRKTRAPKRFLREQFNNSIPDSEFIDEFGQIHFKPLQASSEQNGASFPKGTKERRLRHRKIYIGTKEDVMSDDSCEDAYEKRHSKRTRLNSGPISDLVEHLETLVSKTEGQSEEDRRVVKWKSLESAPVLSMSAHTSSQWIPCNCDSRGHLKEASSSGWEGSAILHQGSLITIGCLHFVFSIAAHGQPKPKSPTVS